MPDPNAISDFIDVTVNLVDGARSAAGFSFPVFVAQFNANASFPDRVKAYSGSPADIDTMLADDGFAVTSGARRMVNAATAQDGPPSTVYLGRWDVTDATLPVALDAILGELTLDNADGYHWHVDPAVATDVDLFQGYVWSQTKFAVFHGQTKTLAVFNQDPGNLVEQVLALSDYTRGSLTWHDASAASNLGPAVLRSTSETFVVFDGSTLSLRIDNGATQLFTFSSSAAVLDGTNAAPFAFTDGDTLELSADGGPAQLVTFATLAAVLTSGAAETYAIADGDTLLVRTDGGAPQTVTFNAAAGAVATVGGDPFVLANLDTLTVAIDGGANQIVTFLTADFATIGAATAEELDAVFAAQITGITSSNDGSDATITSNSLGTASDVEVVAGSVGVLAALGLSAGNNNGTGFAANASVATAVEVAAEIVADTAGLTASGASGSVALTSTTVGKASRVQVTGGTANSELSFSTIETAGSGDFDDASAATIAEVLTAVNARTFGLVASNDGSDRARLTSNTAGSASAIAIAGGVAATTLGLAGAAAGAGFAANATQATAAEVSILIGGTIFDGSAAAISSKVNISTTSTGTAATIVIVGGDAATALGFSPSAIGTGTDEDYVTARWIGRCSTFNLDAEKGAALWDKQKVRGGFPDKLGVSDRTRLHGVFVNTYENRNGRDEFHFGTLLNPAKRYIDERTSADWGDARITEAINNALSTVAEQKTKIDLDDPGINLIASVISGVAQAGDRNGHWFNDTTEVSTLIPNDTGFNVPDITELTDQDIIDRKITGFLLVLRLKGGAQQAAVRFDLTRLLAG